MNDALEQHAAALAARFGDSLKRLESRCGELGYEVPAPTLLEVCRSLRDEEAFGYEQLIDLAGVDYLTYGRGEWDTASATGTGFSRAVERPLTPALSRGAGEGAGRPSPQPSPAERDRVTEGPHPNPLPRSGRGCPKGGRGNPRGG